MIFTRLCFNFVISFGWTRLGFQLIWNMFLHLFTRLCCTNFSKTCYFGNLEKPKLSGTWVLLFPLQGCVTTTIPTTFPWVFLFRECQRVEKISANKQKNILEGTPSCRTAVFSKFVLILLETMAKMWKMLRRDVAQICCKSFMKTFLKIFWSVTKYPRFRFIGNFIWTIQLLISYFQNC